MATKTDANGNVIAFDLNKTTIGNTMAFNIDITPKNGSAPTGTTTSTFQLDTKDKYVGETLEFNVHVGEGLNTSDATATSANIENGKTAYVNNQKITGTVVYQTYYTGSDAPPSSLGNNGDLYFKQGDSISTASEDIVQSRSVLDKDIYTYLNTSNITADSGVTFEVLEDRDLVVTFTGTNQSVYINNSTLSGQIEMNISGITYKTDDDTLLAVSSSDGIGFYNINNELTTESTFTAELPLRFILTNKYTGALPVAVGIANCRMRVTK
jgi:hypothetical protein